MFENKLFFYTLTFLFIFFYFNSHDEKLDHDENIYKRAHKSFSITFLNTNNENKQAYTKIYSYLQFTTLK